MHHHAIQKIQHYTKKYIRYGVPIGLIVLGGIFIFSAQNSQASLLHDVKNFLDGIPLSQKRAIQTPSAQFVGTSQEEAIVSAVEKVAPAVVSIVISKDVPVIEQCPQDPFGGLPEEFQQFFGERFQFNVPCTKGTERRDIGGGSGFVISSDGYIVTNKHVVEDTKAEYTVFTNDGKKYTARVRAKHPSLDIAIMKIQGMGLPYVELGSSSEIKLGQTAIAIGNALGEFRNTVSVGIVSGLARRVTAQSSGGESETIENVIQTDAAINPGNSGGPLLNTMGQVIGINTAMVSGAQSIGFAIPIDAVKKSIESVRVSGEIHVGYLGIRYVLVDEVVKKQYKLSVSEGALIKGDSQNFAVEPGSPADKAGIKEGDILTHVDGIKIDAQHSPAYHIAQKSPKDTMRIDLLRNGEKMTVTAILGERKE